MSFDPQGKSPAGQPLAVHYRRAVPCPGCGSLGVHQLHEDIAVTSQCASGCGWSVSVSWAQIEKEKRSV